jgi:hypothetical protein
MKKLCWQLLVQLDWEIKIKKKKKVVDIFYFFQVFCVNQFFKIYLCLVLKFKKTLMLCFQKSVTKKLQKRKKKKNYAITKSSDSTLGNI